MTSQEAIRGMFGVIDAALLPLASTIIYPNTGTPVPTVGTTTWARVMLQHVQGGQRSIPQENQHSRQEGIVIIQVFEPSGRGLGASTVSDVLLRALRRAAVSSLFFKNATKEEIGISGPWFQVNISAQFDYDTVEP